MAFFDVFVRVFCGVLMLVMPFGLFLYLQKEIGATWRWIGIGAGTFVASQAVHIPLNSFVLEPAMNRFGMGNWKESKGIELFIFAAMFGLSAGVCEEGSRYLVYRYWLTASDAHLDRRWKAAVSLGAGHGGCEAIMLGILVLLMLYKMMQLRQFTDPSKLLPPEKVQEVQEMLDAYWSVSFIPAVERVLSVMIFHMSAAVLVLQVFKTGNRWWLATSIAFHATTVAINVVARVQHKWNTVVTEAVLALLVIPLALKIIFHFRDVRFVEQEEALPSKKMM
jgi:uncharacterized membrane protein YhfC